MPFYWITYDFSNPDSFEDFYKWLASLPNDAKECGINTVLVDFDGDLDLLKTSLLEEVQHIDKERVYIVRTKEDAASGRFLFGKRKKRNPWDVYATVDDVEDDE